MAVISVTSAVKENLSNVLMTLKRNIDCNILQDEGRFRGKLTNGRCVAFVDGSAV